MNKKLAWILVGLVCLIVVAVFIFYGCGQSSSGGSSASTNYTVRGRVGTITASGLKASTADTVTHIVAIGTDNNKTLVTPDADGTFSLALTSGQSYVLGFYNKTGSTITLLGYFQNADYDWDSLPTIDPRDTETDLDTVTIDTASMAATSSVALNSLIAEMNMDVDTATLYGEIDDPLATFTNIDVDSNGEFDFNENKNYLFQTYVGMYESGNPVTGEIDSMLDGYNDTYEPIPSFYSIYFSCLGSGDTRSAGVTATLTPPSAIGGATTQTSTTQADSSAVGWHLFFPAVSTPSVAPTGTYTVAMGTTTYTIRNFQASSAVAIGSNHNLVYPVFHLVTNADGKITTVQYQWKKLVSGTITSASTADVEATINYAPGNTSSFTQNPFISFFAGANNLYTTVGNGGIVLLPLDQTEVDVSALNKTRADIHHIQAGYELTSKVICKFDLY